MPRYLDPSIPRSPFPPHRPSHVCLADGGLTPAWLISVVSTYSGRHCLIPSRQLGRAGFQFGFPSWIREDLAICNAGWKALSLYLMRVFAVSLQ